MRIMRENGEKLGAADNRVTDEESIGKRIHKRLESQQNWNQQK